MEYYQPPQLSEILNRAAQKLGVAVDEASALEIARRARGTPRIALKLLKRVRDFAQIKHQNQITLDVVQQTLDLHAVDSLGLTDGDRQYLTTILTKYQGGPVGLSTLAAATSEDSVTIEEVIEPYLLQIGFIQKTPKGRVVLDVAKMHLK
jgi:Holliday junction DNA helicase RuvB